MRCSWCTCTVAKCLACLLGLIDLCFISARLIHRSWRPLITSLLVRSLIVYKPWFPRIQLNCSWWKRSSGASAAGRLPPVLIQAAPLWRRHFEEVRSSIDLRVSLIEPIGSASYTNAREMAWRVGPSITQRDTTHSKLLKVGSSSGSQLLYCCRRGALLFAGYVRHIGDRHGNCCALGMLS